MSGAETDPKGEFAFFDVTWEDDSQRSNRRAPAELLGRLRRRRTRARLYPRAGPRDRREIRPPVAGDQEHQPDRGEEEIGGGCAAHQRAPMFKWKWA
jgi:hypothetical protein